MIIFTFFGIGKPPAFAQGFGEAGEWTRMTRIGERARLGGWRLRLAIANFRFCFQRFCPFITLSGICRTKFSKIFLNSEKI
jgi:hypothetical protein